MDIESAPKRNEYHLWSDISGISILKVSPYSKKNRYNPPTFHLEIYILSPFP